MNIKLFPFYGYIIGLCFLTACNTDNQAEINSTTVEFNRDIRPILTKHCTGCHGGVSQQSGLSFVLKDLAFSRGHSGRLNIVPGDPDGSELIARVEATDVNIRMPYKADALTKKDIQLLRDWISQGAKWQEHWAFEKPEQPNVPKLTDTSKINNNIDLFIQDKLEQSILTPANKADKNALLRRLSFDLIGLPPTLDEITSFETDTSPQAYEKQVDRLLASPQFGERWATMWLDIARYADSQGYFVDHGKDVWPYRDWVIKAFNDNLSYEDFIIEQLAGDLLPNRNVDNLIATSFHRQSISNSEAGTDDEEFRVVAVQDKVTTTWAALNGITMNCVQCHDHPYDPIKQKAYYTSYSFFNTTEDADRFNDEPLMRIAHNPEEKVKAFEFQEQKIAIAKAFVKQAISLADDKNQWKKLNLVNVTADELKALRELRGNYEQQIAKKSKALALEANKKTKKDIKWSIEQIQKKIINVDLNIERHKKTQKPNLLTTQNGEYYSKKEHVPSHAYFTLQSDKLTSQKINAVRFTALPLDPEAAIFTPDFSFSIDNINMWLIGPDGKKQQLPVAEFMANSSEGTNEQLLKLNKVQEKRTLNGLAPHEMQASNDDIGKANAFFAHRLFYPRWTVAVLSKPMNIPEGSVIELELAQLQNRRLNDGRSTTLERFKVELSNSEHWLQYAKNEERLKSVKSYSHIDKQLQAIDGINMPVVYEQDTWEQRKSALFTRGSYVAKEGPHLLPDVPKIMPKLTSAEHADRLTLARWFFTEEQPLTARVMVNRFWHQLFGRGIVDTLEDFGSAGSEPSHPKLLDWLALTFQRELKWDMKAIIKVMVMSHTYQQNANISAQALKEDPNNVLLSHGPRQRLTAEMIRDQALLASDLLHSKLYGKPVMPPQPEGIWEIQKKKSGWVEAEGNDRYRRAIYTYIKRSKSYPSFLTFDMEVRDMSHARRIPTNTPLQALVTLNDPVYHEAAEALAAQMLAIASQQNEDKAIEKGFKKVLSRSPDDVEKKRLKQAVKLIQEELGQHQTLQVWTAIAKTLLNLDGTLVR